MYELAIIIASIIIMLMHYCVYFHMLVSVISLGKLQPESHNRAFLIATYNFKGLEEDDYLQAVS